ncbi:HlyD family efflux transporter periplasmic adaptor subunit [Chromatocurvus halotolerans]|uniref:Multidrug resistance efflux pump n=1 Tax=Chromatocurvus halotolerans TaxID=1132028 RepID=A0A4R2KTV7_9GAMM|nr:HlyD family efflux transporter periplasmic adaptor subunit [Chromatocurvus halotolerans]TCO76292.1 multidrug resistance efflux pump [Chromatocurvus halotolerans]
MRLHNRTSTVSIGPEPVATKSRGAQFTQFLYLAILVAFLAYLLQLGWRYATRLELTGQVMVETRVLGAPLSGQVTPKVMRAQTVRQGDILALIDPQLACEERLLEDRRLEQVRHDLRLAKAENRLLDERLQRLQQQSPASTVQRALELDNSRGDPLIAWRERVQALEDEKELGRIATVSLEARLAEITAQSELLTRLDPACLTQALRAPEDGTVIALRREPSEFIERGEPLILFRETTPRVWIEVFAAGDELSALVGQATAKVTLPDGRESEGRVKRVESSAADAPRLETQDYVPVAAALRVVLAPADAATAAEWASYSRMNVKVMVKR